MELMLIRTYFEDGTNGDLYVNGSFHSHTIELPWKDNAARLSCIPEGRYQVVKRSSQKFKEHLLLKGVAGRDLILIHPANHALKELKGCIAPVTQLQGPGIGLRSRIPFEALRKEVYRSIDNDEPVYITIKKNDHE